MSNRITQRLSRDDQREPRLTVILEAKKPSEIVPDTFFADGQPQASRKTGQATRATQKSGLNEPDPFVARSSLIDFD
jgi:hypothetical protein